MSQPKSERSHISRKDLIDRVLAKDASLVLFVAPAGFGKTNAMMQLRDAFKLQGMTTAWWSLDKQDNDPQRLLSFLRDILGSAHQQAPIAAYGLSVPISHPLAIFLDDFEAVDGGPLPQIVLNLLGQLPPGSRMVIGSRRKPGMGLAKLKLQGAVLEFNENDLQFSRAQSDQLLQSAMGTAPLSDTNLRLLYEKTAGWPAAVALAGIALGHEHQTSPGLVHQMSATVQPVEEYLSEVVLDHQAQEIREFLLSTSVLHQLDATICQALVPQLNAAYLLQRLMENNLFVSSVPGQIDRWRYHPLFADILRSILKRKKPEDFLRLHLAAASVYESQGQVVPAIDHIIAGGDFPYAARLLAQHAKQLLIDGRIKLLARWLESIPPPVLREHSVLLATHLWVTTFTQGAAQAMHKAEKIAPAWPGTDSGAQAHHAALHCSWLFMMDKPHEAGAIGLQALSKMPTAEPYADNVLSVSMAIYFVQDGNRAAANRLLNAARERQGNTAFMRMFIESAESEQELQDGRLKQAMARLRIAVGATHSNSGVLDITNGNAWAGVLYGVACYEAGDVDQAQRLLSAYLPIVQSVGSHDHLILALVCLSRMAHARGETQEAIRYLAELEHTGATRQLPRLMASAWLERAHTEILAGQAGAAEHALARADLAEVWQEPRPLRRLAHSALDPKTCQLRWLLHFGDARQALQAINSELAHSRSIQWNLRCISLELLRAAALFRCQQESSALDQMQATLDFAGQQGLVSRVRDEGPIVMQLVDKLLIRERNKGTDGQLVHYLRHLQNSNASVAAKDHESKATVPESQGLLSPLTQKEHELLKLLTEGHSNQALAQQLRISESTVRTHLRSIHAKLQVQSRMQAVAKARQLGIVT